MKTAVARSLMLASCFVAAVALANAGDAFAASVASLDATNPMTWLVKSVCTNSLDQPVAADPYGGCPFGDGIRKIRSGDPLPYHNVDQEGVQQRDAFPVIYPINGKTSIIATFDYFPFNRFNLYNGTDGYDVFTVRKDWVSITNTSDGGGYGQTFYGNPCTIGGGWVLFPASNFLMPPDQAGHEAVQMRGVNWEQRDQNYPGDCPLSYAMPQTSWSYQSDFAFGGDNGSPKIPKIMQTVISNHGFPSDPMKLPNFLLNGHLEVFYFTREYGITRWEVWTPIQQSPKKTA